MKRDTEETENLDQSAELWPARWTAAGVVEVLEPLALPERKARIWHVVSQRLGSVTVVMDAPHDPHNGAAILRSCDAFGVPEVHVVRREEPFQIARRVTKRTERWLDVRVHATPADAIKVLKTAGFMLVATHPQGDLVPHDLRSIPKLALVFGNEHDGICEALERAADHAVRIPMRGFVESLNVSVAAAILLENATEARTSDLPEPARQRLYARALWHSVPRAAQILAASPAR